MKAEYKKQQKKNKQKQKGAEIGTEVIFCCAFKLGFLQLICEASLIFKSNLELTLSIILKQSELYESKHVSEEC